MLRINLNTINKDLIKTQRLELSRKVTLEGINKMAQFSKKHYKDIAQLAGKENKLLQNSSELLQTHPEFSP